MHADRKRKEKTPNRLSARITARDIIHFIGEEFFNERLFIFLVDFPEFNKKNASNSSDLLRFWTTIAFLHIEDEQSNNVKYSLKKVIKQLFCCDLLELFQ